MEGNGWSFNPGNPANAITSPLWLALLAIVALVTTLDLGSFAGLYGVCVSAFGLAIYSLLKDRGSLFAFSISLGMITLPGLWEAAAMEGALEFALIAWTLFAYHKRRSVLTGCLLGLCVLARPDTGILAVMLAANDLLRRRQLPIKMTLSAIAVVLPWAVFSWIQFGSLTPDTLAIKTTQSSIGVWAQTRPFIIEALSYQRWCPVMLVIAIAGFILNSTAFRRLPEALWLLTVYGFLHAVAYQLIGAPSSYAWYYIPFHISLFLMWIMGWFALLNLTVERVLKT